MKFNTGGQPLNRLIATLCLGAALAAPLTARADEMSDKVAEATKLVNRTLIKICRPASTSRWRRPRRDAGRPGRVRA